MAIHPAFLSVLYLFYLYVYFEFQLNSPNRILLLHLSIVCLSLSILYLWILINNSIMQSPLSRYSIATVPESAAISTATSTSGSSRSSYFSQQWSAGGDVTTHSPITESIHDSVCSVNDLLIHLLQPIGLWTISCINFDRYYAICSPLHYNTLFTTKKVRNTISCRDNPNKGSLKKLTRVFVAVESVKINSNSSTSFWKAFDQLSRTSLQTGDVSES